MLYHYRIACGHFARALMQGDERARPVTGPVAVLHLLWAQAPDPTVASAVVRVPFEQFTGYVGTRERMRQVLAALSKVGAVRKTEFGYALTKPPFDELDSIARGQVQAAASALGVHVDVDAKPIARDVVKHERQLSRKHAEEQRNTVLKRLDQRPSDVRDVLARAAGVPAEKLRYSGQGSGPVVSAINWLAKSGASWADFCAVCLAARKDTSADKPVELQWLFASKHADYLQRIASTVLGEAKPLAPDPVLADESKRMLSFSRSDVIESVARATGNDQKSTGEFVDAYWTPAIAPLSASEFRARLKPWSSAPAGAKPPFSEFVALFGAPV